MSDSDARKTTIDFLGATQETAQETTSETTQESYLTRLKYEARTVKFYLMVVLFGKSGRISFES
ncbi:hypothetical protein EMIT093MI4_180044 [Pseudomonas sp. IT-93MI4]